MKSFADLQKKLAALPRKKRLGVVVAQDEHTLDAVIMAAKNKLVQPVLLGNAHKISALLAVFNYPESEVEIHDIALPRDCARVAASMVHQGELDCLMKGSIETSELMKVLVNREEGIRQSDTMTAVAFIESPYYHKLFGITDAGLLPYPTIVQKRDAIQNAVDAFCALGVKMPKVGVLAAVEHVNPKMIETVEASQLEQMSRDGRLKNCIVEGPIAYDLAMSREAAKLKGYDSPVAGDVDILAVPDLVCGNSLFKCLAYTGGAKFAGAVFGAKVPLILTSRSSSMEDKYQSILLNALVG